MRYSLVLAKKRLKKETPKNRRNNFHSKSDFSVHRLIMRDSSLWRVRFVRPSHVVLRAVFRSLSTDSRGCVTGETETDRIFRQARTIARFNASHMSYGAAAARNSECWGPSFFFVSFLSFSSRNDRDQCIVHICRTARPSAVGQQFRSEWPGPTLPRRVHTWHAQCNPEPVRMHRRIASHTSERCLQKFCENYLFKVEHWTGAAACLQKISGCPVRRVARFRADRPINGFNLEKI